jgi:hypothetical protein
MRLKPAENTIRKSNDLPWYSPRPWHGMTFGVWTRLLANHRYRVSLPRLPMAVLITMCSTFNSFSRWQSEASFGHSAEQVPIEHDPIFVIGHWRTGTTLIHELLVQDPQFGFPNTFQCMAPHHFLRTERYVSSLASVLLPKKRVMDNMAFGWNRPQEDEFALCNLGLPSLYTYWAFPKGQVDNKRCLSLDALNPVEKQYWKDTFEWFLRRVTMQDPRQLVLKSPPHTARLRTILDLFPNAKFIHLVRNPAKVIPSTVLTWERMCVACELQSSRTQRFEDQVFDNFREMYQAYWRDRSLLSADQICDVRYEELSDDPIGQMSKIYRTLGLVDFQKVKPQLEAYVAGTQGYRRNRFNVNEQLESRIFEHCREYADKYGYEPEYTTHATEQALDSLA